MSLIGTGRGQVSASLVDRAFHAASERLVAYGHLTRRELDAVTDETPEADAAAALSTLGQLQALAMLERLEAMREREAIASIPSAARGGCASGGVLGLERLSSAEHELLVSLRASRLVGSWFAQLVALLTEREQLAAPPHATDDEEDEEEEEEEEEEENEEEEDDYDDDDDDEDEEEEERSGGLRRRRRRGWLKGGVADVLLTVTSHLDAGMLRFTCTPTTRMAELMAAYRRCAEAHGTDRRTLSSARFLYFDKVITPEVTAAELELFDGDQIVLVERAHETEEEYEGRWGHLRARGIRLPDYWGHTPWHNSPKSAARLIELLARNHRDRGWVQTILTREASTHAISSSTHGSSSTPGMLAERVTSNASRRPFESTSLAPRQPARHSSRHFRKGLRWSRRLAPTLVEPSRSRWRWC